MKLPLPLLLAACVALTTVYALAQPASTERPATPTKTGPASQAGEGAKPSDAAQPPPASAAATGAAATPGKPAVVAQVSENSQAAPVEADWDARADAWFESEDPKARRKQMRQITKALKQSCFYCHTRGFKGYHENKLISQQMMAMSAEHGVECKECHVGKKGLTELGETAQHMWRLVHEKKVFCDHCHVPQKRFQELTPEGKAFKAEGQKE